MKSISLEELAKYAGRYIAFSQDRTRILASSKTIKGLVKKTGKNSEERCHNQFYTSSNYRIFPYDIECYLDSGSQFNLFPAEVREKLGIKITKGRKIEHTGIGNRGIIAYEHGVKIFLNRFSFKTDVHFSYDHKIPLLGRHGFFRYFKRVIFNEKDLQFELEY